MNAVKLRIALRVISGKCTSENIPESYVNILGWDWHNPTDDELKEKAVDIIDDTFSELFLAVDSLRQEQNQDPDY